MNVSHSMLIMHVINDKFYEEHNTQEECNNIIGSMKWLVAAMERLSYLILSQYKDWIQGVIKGMLSGGNHKLKGSSGYLSYILFTDSYE